MRQSCSITATMLIDVNVVPAHSSRRMRTRTSNRRSVAAWPTDDDCSGVAESSRRGKHRLIEQRLLDEIGVVGRYSTMITVPDPSQKCFDHRRRFLLQSFVVEEMNEHLLPISDSAQQTMDVIDGKDSCDDHQRRSMSVRVRVRQRWPLGSHQQMKAERMEKVNPRRPLVELNRLLFGETSMR